MRFLEACLDNLAREFAMIRDVREKTPGRVSDNI